jgi:hypothetical protein
MSLRRGDQREHHMDDCRPRSCTPLPPLRRLMLCSMGTVPTVAMRGTRPAQIQSKRTCKLPFTSSSMPGLGLSGLSGGSLYGGMSRPGLSRTLSMHPDQEERLLSHVEEEEEEAQQEEGVFGSSCPTPHEALSLSWPDDHLAQETPSRPASPTPLLES